MSPSSVIAEIPRGGLAVLVNVGIGIEAIPLVRQARDAGVRVLTVDRWRRFLGYTRDSAPDIYGAFTHYVGTALQAAQACKPDSVDAAVYLRGQPTAEEWAEWTIKTRNGRVVFEQ